MEKSLIMLIGASGTGKTTLGRSATKELQKEMSVEHISTGNLVRYIGSGAVASAFRQEILTHLLGDNPNERLDDDIIKGIISEAIWDSSADLILLDGAPRTPHQVDDISELAVKDQRKIAGALLTFVASREQNIARLLKRSPREFSRQLFYDEAVAQLDYTNQTLDSVTDKLWKNALPLRYLETSGEKTATTQQGVELIKHLLSD